MVSTHSRPKAAGLSRIAALAGDSVSTHSRPKAAGAHGGIGAIDNGSFNTQPPEGGWLPPVFHNRQSPSFNTQPPEGGWRLERKQANGLNSFNTQPPEGGWGDTKI